MRIIQKYILRSIVNHRPGRGGESIVNSAFFPVKMVDVKLGQIETKYAQILSLTSN